MVQILESTKDFDICGGLNPVTVRVSTANHRKLKSLKRFRVAAPFSDPQLLNLGLF